MKNMKRLTLTGASVFVFGLLGCAGITVMQVNSIQYPVHDVCIKPTPKQPVPEFLLIIQQDFARHGIRTRVMEDPVAGKATLQQIFAQCDYSLTYYANMWRTDDDLQVGSVYISLFRGDLEIGYAHRDLPKSLFGKSTVDVGHWDSTRSKIDPMIDTLLGGFPIVAPSPPQTPTHSDSVIVPPQNW